MLDVIPSAPWNLTYADGSANVYRWWQEQPGAPVRFEYDPVTPEMSSTGLYSGGAPREEQLDADDPRLVELWAKTRALEADTTHHAPDRNKGTGAFSLVTPEGSARFIIEQGQRLESLAPLLARFGAK